MLIVPGSGAGGLGATYGDTANTGVTVMRAWEPQGQGFSAKAWPPHALSMPSGPGSRVHILMPKGPFPDSEAQRLAGQSHTPTVRQPRGEGMRQEHGGARHELRDS